VYEFLTDFSTFLMASGIIIVALVQRPPPNTGKALMLLCEIAKSVLATAIWIWLMIDAVLGPRKHSDPHSEIRLIISAVSDFSVVSLQLKIIITR